MQKREQDALEEQFKARNHSVMPCVWPMMVREQHELWRVVVTPLVQQKMCWKWCWRFDLGPADFLCQLS